MYRIILRVRVNYSMEFVEMNHIPRVFDPLFIGLTFWAIDTLFGELNFHTEVCCSWLHLITVYNSFLNDSRKYVSRVKWTFDYNAFKILDDIELNINKVLLKFSGQMPKALIKEWVIIFLPGNLLFRLDLSSKNLDKFLNLHYDCNFIYWSLK